jgi:hypothetical protein
MTNTERAVKAAAALADSLHTYVAVTGVVNIGPTITVADRDGIYDKVTGLGQVIERTTTRVIRFELRGADLWDLRELVEELADEVMAYEDVEVVVSKADVVTRTEAEDPS